MFILKLLLCSLGIYFSAAYVPFSLQSCGGIWNPLLTVTGGLQSHPIEIPGEVRPYGTITLHRPIRGHLRAYVTVYKWIVLGYRPIPCVANFGSCSYDVCDLLAWFEGRSCPQQFENSHVPCTCPFYSGSYTFNPYSHQIPMLEFPLQWLANGDYRVKLQLLDTSTYREVACYNLEFTVRPRRTRGWWRR